MLAFFLCLLQSPESADSIMKKVAENQDRAETARSQFVYRQVIDGRLLRTNQKLAREEHREYSVAPTPDGTKKELVVFRGRYEKGGKLLDYDKPGFQHKDTDVDGDLLNDLIDDLTNDKESKDGVSIELFPLTRDRQFKYDFKLHGTRELKGRKAYRISFHPKDKEDFDWEGEVLVDAEAYQPLSVVTKMSRGIPWGVKVFLGTNIKQLGFSLAYEEVDEGIWFPVSYGTEFRFDILFSYKRIVTLALTNSDFKRTSVDSKIDFKTQ